jgi:hypothetical protein
LSIAKTSIEPPAGNKDRATNVQNHSLTGKPAGKSETNGTQILDS